MSDEELAQISAAGRVERTLSASGCLGVLGLILLLIVDALFVGPAIWPFLFGLIVILAVVFWAHGQVTRRKQPYRDELAWRRGEGPFARYVDEAQAIFDHSPASWVILFTIRGLPHGDHRWLRLVLSESPLPSGQAEWRIWHPTQTLFTCGDGDVPAAFADGLLSFLKTLDVTKLTDLPAFVFDGAPCEIAVLRREPRLTISAGCNIAGLAPEHSEHPTAILCSKLADIVHQCSLWKLHEAAGTVRSGDRTV